MSGLLDDIRSASVVDNRCAIHKAFQALTKNDQKDLAAALQDPEIEGTVIARVLRERGIQVSDRAVQRHRRDGCKCGAVKS